jgi:hypothetical protein
MVIEWRDVQGSGGRYRVSSDGQVMSYVRRKPKLRKPCFDRKGYARVTLSLDGRRPTLHMVHRLMAFAFLTDSWFPGAVVCHNDGNQANNTVEKRDGTSGYGNTAAWKRAMGIDWMTGREMAQAIPPLYTEYLGGQLLQAIGLAA